MNFTFGIITNDNDANINIIAESIRNLDIPNYEIIVVGKCGIQADDIRVLSFDETIISKLITKKKNMITDAATYENVVYLHDYITFDKNWYNGFLKYGNDFNICMNNIVDARDKRFRDWVVEYKGEVRLIPYEVTDLSKFIYFSGAYWVAKKEFMLKYPLNEKLSWGQGEDCEWSYRVREVTDFKVNSYSTVKFLKQKQNKTITATAQDIKEMRKQL